MLTATETQTQPTTGVAVEVVVGAVAGAVLRMIVVGVLITAFGVVIRRYRLSTYCCVNTLSILVLQLYFTFTTQNKTERNDVIP